MAATIRQIVDGALEYVGQVPGVSVQHYSEDRVRSDAIRSFNFLFKKYHWPQYRKWFRIQLDGTEGIPSTDAFEQVQDHEDFIGVYRDAQTRPLPVMAEGYNPYRFGSGLTQVQYWTALNVTHEHYRKRKLQFYPVTSTGYVNVQAMVYPLTPPALNFDWEDTFYLDKDMLVYGTAFMTLSGDDLNPGAADIARVMMDTRYKDIINALSNHPIAISGSPEIPSTYYEVP